MKLSLWVYSIVTTFSVAPGVGPLVVSAFVPVPHHHHQHQSKNLQMFTGIVEEMGTVVSLEEREDMILWDGSKGKGTELVVHGNVVMEGAYLGYDGRGELKSFQSMTIILILFLLFFVFIERCSICVSGVCLTATNLNQEMKEFKVGLAPETLSRTYFKTLKAGDAVNLERASEIGGRNSGHFVQGHVDGTGTVRDRWIEEDSMWYKITVDDPDLLRYIVPKGFIAIDGTSLTVVDVNMEEGWFSFMLVEYTQKKIVIPSKLEGAKVNLEVDVLGKYSETAMAAIIPRLEALEAKVASLEKAIKAKE